jgi:uncharacterized membrane protein
LGTEFVFVFRTNKILVMNMKRTFGGILTILGIAGLIYTGASIIERSAHATTLFVIGFIGLIFFFSGIGLIKKTADDAG